MLHAAVDDTHICNGEPSLLCFLYIIRIELSSLGTIGHLHVQVCGSVIATDNVYLSLSAVICFWTKISSHHIVLDLTEGAWKRQPLTHGAVIWIETKRKTLRY